MSRCFICHPSVPHETTAYFRSICHYNNHSFLAHFFSPENLQKYPHSKFPKTLWLPSPFCYAGHRTLALNSKRRSSVNKKNLFIFILFTVWDCFLLQCKAGQSGSCPVPTKSSLLVIGEPMESVVAPSSRQQFIVD